MRDSRAHVIIARFTFCVLNTPEQSNPDKLGGPLLNQLYNVRNSIFQPISRAAVTENVRTCYAVQINIVQKYIRITRTFLFFV